MTGHLSDERRRAGGKDSRIYGPDFRRSTLKTAARFDVEVGID